MANKGKAPLPRVRAMCVTAVFMALTAISGMWSLPLGPAHVYLTDIFVCIAALLLPPGWSWIAGGIGAFLGDLIFYPQAMLLTLITVRQLWLQVQVARLPLMPSAICFPNRNQPMESLNN